ncbi:MAG: DUF3313 family protein [Sulfurimonas sp.]|uniref:DUF3313 family protein n=1 Tax=Sulfurimonas sp. TaxID=2022749 RepID=UPI0028CF4B7D|nr:DUF3313 family protein [Sulfurimonas sp.]MDT8337710.1 DUF3313 family protein [Sulfurimonas sp.]
MKLSTTFTVALIAFAFLINGCAGKSVAAKNSGFFNDYTQFKSSDGLSATKSFKEYEISKHKTVLISPTKVIAMIPESQQSDSQKMLYKKISEYVTEGYKSEIQKNSNFKVVNTKEQDTIVLESAISAVEVHFDDKKWNQFSPIAMDVTVTSYNSYADGNVRILGEKRIIDATTGESMFESMEIIKDEKIILDDENLKFENIKPALDKWIELTVKHFQN